MHFSTHLREQDAILPTWEESGTSNGTRTVAVFKEKGEHLYVIDAELTLYLEEPSHRPCLETWNAS